MPDLLHHPDFVSTLTTVADAPRWVVGFSGGLDSTVLLHLLGRWSGVAEVTPPLLALHVHHGMQAQADAWQAHCARFCASLSIPFAAVRARVVNRGQGDESAARSARYAAFEAELAAGEVVHLAHHLDDQVETFFLRLMRGAGLEGLAAMPVTRGLGAGALVRPLLALSRDELEGYARHWGLSWIEDPSNTKLRYDRNFLRLEVLPLLQGRWPGYRQTVARATVNLAEASDQLQSDLPTCYSALGDPGVRLADVTADATPEQVQRRLRLWLVGKGLLAPPRAALAEFVRQLLALGVESRPELKVGGWHLRYYAQALYLLPQPAKPSGGGQPLRLLPGGTIELPDGSQLALLAAPPGQGLVLSAGEALEVRFRSGGERCQPVQREHSASLKQLLQEWSVPPWWRQRTPLLYLDGELLAVADLWLCRSSRLACQEGPGWRLQWKRNTTVMGTGD